MKRMPPYQIERFAGFDRSRTRHIENDDGHGNESRASAEEEHTLPGVTVRNDSAEHEPDASGENRRGRDQTNTERHAILGEVLADQLVT